MFNTSLIKGGLTLPKVIGGISKTLQIANQIIPLYQKAKPMISNARSILSVMKGISKTTPKTIEAKDVKIVNSNKSTQNTTKKAETTTPTFFL